MSNSDGVAQIRGALGTATIEDHGAAAEGEIVEVATVTLDSWLREGVGMLVSVVS